MALRGYPKNQQTIKTKSLFNFHWPSGGLDKRWNATVFGVRCLNSLRVWDLAAKLGLGFPYFGDYLQLIWTVFFKRNRKRTGIIQKQRPIVFRPAWPTQRFGGEFWCRNNILLAKKPNQNHKDKRQIEFWCLDRVNLKWFGRPPKTENFEHFYFVLGDLAWGIRRQSLGLGLSFELIVCFWRPHSPDVVSFSRKYRDFDVWPTSKDRAAGPC